MTNINGCEKIKEIIIVSNNKSFNDLAVRLMLEKDFKVSFYWELLGKEVELASIKDGYTTENVQKENFDRVRPLIDALPKYKDNPHVLLVCECEYIEVFEKEFDDVNIMRKQAFKGKRFLLDDKSIIYKMLSFFPKNDSPFLHARIKTDLVAYDSEGYIPFGGFKYTFGRLFLPGDNERKEIEINKAFYPYKKGKTALSDKSLSEMSSEELSDLPLSKIAIYKDLSKIIKRQNKLNGVFGFFYKYLNFSMLRKGE